MCAANALAIYLCFAFPAAATAPQGMPETYDHFQPVKLNQAAIDRLRNGDAATAQILLERAALLAPFEPAISRNLAELRTYREAPAPIELRQDQAPASTLDRSRESGPEDAAASGTTTLPPLPALWPKK